MNHTFNKNPGDTFHDIKYLDLLRKILYHGEQKTDRTGTGTISLFAQQLRFDVSDGTIPILTTKKIHLKSVIHELLWIISGDTKIDYLHENGVTIWDEWANENGDLGPVYGEMLRNFPNPFDKNVDQLKQVINDIKTNPDSRRLLVSLWHPGVVPYQALPPCHYSFQFFCNKATKDISLLLNMRSIDMFLGLPFNIASYTILLYMVASITGYKPKEFVWNGCDCHIYSNHVNQVTEQLARLPYPSPTITINPEVKNIDDFIYQDIQIESYQHHPVISAPVAV